MATAKAAASNAPVEAPVVRVIGQGTFFESGLPFLLVTSASELGRAHVVAYAYEGAFVGSRCQCDCTAAQFGKSCRHVLVAREWLATTTAKASKTAKTAEKADRVSRAAKAAETPSAKYRQSNHPGDTAMMARSQKAFSLLK